MNFTVKCIKKTKKANDHTVCQCCYRNQNLMLFGGPPSYQHGVPPQAKPPLSVACVTPALMRWNGRAFKDWDWILDLECVKNEIRTGGWGTYKPAISSNFAESRATLANCGIFTGYAPVLASLPLCHHHTPTVWAMGETLKCRENESTQSPKGEEHEESAVARVAFLGLVFM